MAKQQAGHFHIVQQAVAMHSCHRSGKQLSTVKDIARCEHVWPWGWHTSISAGRQNAIRWAGRAPTTPPFAFEVIMMGHCAPNHTHTRICLDPQHPFASDMPSGEPTSEKVDSVRAECLALRLCDTMQESESNLLQLNDNFIESSKARASVTRA